MHDRLMMYGFEYDNPDDRKVEVISDVANTLDDLFFLYNYGRIAVL